MDTYFNFNRFLLVLKRDLLENGKTALFGMLTILSVFSVILALSSLEPSINDELQNFNATLYMIGFLIVGIFFSGMAFKDLRNKERAMSYLMLPASILEKFLSILFLTTVGFIVSYTALFELFNLLNMVIIKSFPPALNLEIFNPFIHEVWKAILIFLPIQSIFLVGSASFKKVPVFYTALYTFIAFLIYGFIIFLIINYVTGSMSFTGNDGVFVLRSHSVDGTHIDTNIKNIFSIKIFLFFFTYLLAPIFWTIAWFKLKEKEV